MPRAPATDDKQPPKTPVENPATDGGHDEPVGGGHKDKNRRVMSAAPDDGPAAAAAASAGGRRRPLVGAIDQGTSSTRFIAFDDSGDKAAQCQVETKSAYPQPGWVEQAPEDIYDTVVHCMRAVEADLKAAGPDAGELVAVGITNQRETTIVWDKTTGKPLHPALVWMDARTKDMCDALIRRTGSADAFRAQTGLPISTYFSAMKLRWLLDNAQAVRDAVSAGNALFGTVDCWLIWKLTGGPQGGVHVTDVTNASRTLLMNLHTRQWDAAVCKALGIPMALLPRIASSAEVYGRIASGPFAGVPISGCLGDQQAALLGQLCVTPGAVKNTYGTGCFMLMHTGTSAVPSSHGLLTTAAFQLGPQQPLQYALEGSVAVAGSAVEWLRDQMKVIPQTSAINECAKEKPDTGGAYFVPAFGGLLSPYWRDDARGVFVGLTHSTGRSELCRAVLESVAYQTREVLDAMELDAAKLTPAVRVSTLQVDGGMTASDVMLQFQADILGVRVSRPNNAEATAAGAAFAAGLAVGVWASVDDIRTHTRTGANKEALHFDPNFDAQTRASKLAGWKKAVTKSFGWIEPAAGAAAGAAAAAATTTAGASAGTGAAAGEAKDSKAGHAHASDHSPQQRHGGRWRHGQHHSGPCGHHHRLGASKASHTHIRGDDARADQHHCQHHGFSGHTLARVLGTVAVGALAFAAGWAFARRSANSK